MKKRTILLLILLVIATTANVSAQFYKAKKVAITEVVDKSGEVADGTKVYIRSALTDAITNSEGYEGYMNINFNKFDMNFDVTGNISSSTRNYLKKQLLDYILISEITPLDKKTVLLSARIVNTSTGKIVASSSVRTYASIDCLNSACCNLTIELVGSI
ncbi:MAG: hypothetical protein IJ442_04525 [Bacteroidaceae bacterium]|nr:hypothetical protein [Bacteroidaceae bacterium]